MYFTFKKFGLWNLYGLVASAFVYVGVSRIYSSKSADVGDGFVRLCDLLGLVNVGEVAHCL